MGVGVSMDVLLHVVDVVDVAPDGAILAVLSVAAREATTKTRSNTRRIIRQ